MTGSRGWGWRRRRNKWYAGSGRNTSGTSGCLRTTGDWSAWTAETRHRHRCAPRAGLIRRHGETLFVGSILLHIRRMNCEVLTVASADTHYTRRIVDQIQRNVLLNSSYLRNHFERRLLSSQQIGIRRREPDTEIQKWRGNLSALFAVFNLCRTGNLGSIP